MNDFKWFAIMMIGISFSLSAIVVGVVITDAPVSVARAKAVEACVVAGNPPKECRKLK